MGEGLFLSWAEQLSQHLNRLRGLFRSLQLLEFVCHFIGNDIIDACEGLLNHMNGHGQTRRICDRIVWCSEQGKLLLNGVFCNAGTTLRPVRQ